MKKPFKETAVGKFLAEKAPNILDKVGDVLPDKGVLGIVKNLISSDDKLTPEQKTEGLRLAQEHELEMEKQAILFEQTVTDRWKADAMGDSWMSKNARPITLLSLLAFLYLIIISDSFPSFNFEVKDAYVELLQMLLTTTVIAYMGARSFDKTQSFKTKK